MKKFFLIIVFIIIGIAIFFSTNIFSISNNEIEDSNNSITNDTTTVNEIIDNNLEEMLIILNDTIINNSVTSDNTISLDIENINNHLNIVNQLENGFELPINGASGYCSISTKLKSKNSISSDTITTLKAGTGFQIIEEKNGWWYILVSKKKGWVQNKYCMINLPDILPSIIYDNTNSYSSLFMSSGIKLPNITGKALYNTYVENDRLNKKEYIMPILYPTAKKIAKAQQLALKNNQSLKVYETFRPYQTQKRISNALSNLMNINETVRKGINSNGWNKSWFIAQTLSNHQRGIAIDVSLVDIEKSKQITIGDYNCLKITEYNECTMPTQMHELSTKAVTFKYGVSTQSKTAWKNVPFSNTMTKSAKTLQNYFVESGMYPISSEWWHFNDLDTKDLIGNNYYSTGQYYITKCYSAIPE